MARITPQLRQRYGPLLTGSVPGSVLAAIDDTELEDRLVQASGLMQQVAKAATPGDGRRFGEQAQRILMARPRAETEQIVVQKMAKAKRLGDNPQAAHLERQARAELLAHPPAVRRQGAARVVKAAKPKAGPGGMVAVFDQNGRLVGVCSEGDIQPVTTSGAETEPADDVAKAAARAADAAVAKLLRSSRTGRARQPQRRTGR